MTEAIEIAGDANRYAKLLEPTEADALATKGKTVVRRTSSAPTGPIASEAADPRVFGVTQLLPPE